MARLPQFVVGEGSRSQGPYHYLREHWHVDCFPKNDGQLYYTGTDPKVVLE